MLESMIAIDRTVLYLVAKILIQRSGRFGPERIHQMK